MKKVLFLLAMMFISFAMQAQEENPMEAKATKKLTREQKAEQRLMEDAETAKGVGRMLANQKFVLEADYLSVQGSPKTIVSSIINFIAIDSNKITIQLASRSGIGGANGLGGITTQGYVSKYTIKKTGKNQDNYFIRIIANTTAGNFDILMNVSPGGRADASLSGNGGGKLNYFGNMVPLHLSKVFKGMST